MCSNQERGGLNLFSYFCNTETRVFKLSVWLVFGLLIINKHYALKMLHYEFYKSFRKGYFLNCCSLVYSANHIKLLQKSAFEFIHHHL